MNDYLNIVGIIIICLLCGTYLWIAASTSRKNDHYIDSELKYTFQSLLKYVKHGLYELSAIGTNDWGMSEAAWNKRVNARAELRQALKGCSFGDRQDKRFVQSHIRDLILVGYQMNEEQINKLIHFDEQERLTAQDRFEIIMYLKCKEWGDDALEWLIEAYHLDHPKHSDLGDGSFSYEITEEDIHSMFHMEYRPLSFEEKLDIVVQRVYQQYKGFSVIDMIREQRIDGVSGGVSGVITKMEDLTYSTEQLERKDEDGKPVTYAWDSVWIFYKGKSIRLSFLSFGSQHELKRVCHNIYKYNLPGQLSEANGYKVNEMKDGSRVVVVRPPFAESWAFFIRKFDVKAASLEQLIQGEDAMLPIQLLQYLMKGSRITAITGAQGAGKTTLMMAMVKYIYASYTLRVQEMSFELNLRQLYSSRNILSFRETDYVTGQAGLDLQKKTDGTVNILGEIATDEVAAWMIQMAQVASLFTIFSHHAKTFADLISSLRNSLLKTGVFRDEKIAELQVASVINFDIHLKRDIHGHRYIERITECCPIDRSNLTSSEMLPYEERVILEHRDGRYVAVNSISTRSQEEMMSEMMTQDKLSFQKFMEMNWRECIGA